MTVTFDCDEDHVGEVVEEVLPICDVFGDEDLVVAAPPPLGDR